MSLEVEDTPLAGVRIIKPRVFRDSRGYFAEVYQEDAYRRVGIDKPFVQDNQSVSGRHVLRGLHYQLPNPQGKLVTCLSGEVFDVAVDLRRGSDTFRRWFGVVLSSTNQWQLYIPEGFAHGFCVLGDGAHVLYKCTDYYSPAAEHTLIWNDPEIGIEWPMRKPVVSDKDARGKRIADCQVFT